MTDQQHGERAANPAPTGLGIDDIPSYIRSAFTPQMRDVVELQLARSAAQVTAESRLDQSADIATRIEAMRSDYRAERSFWNTGGPEMAGRQDVYIQAAGVDVPVRIHRPVETGPLPAIVFFHGGGFSLGDLDTHDRIMRMLADVSGAGVVGVDYSLSPQVRFPQALHECAGVVAELAINGQKYGVDSDRLAVAGDSAGAMLSLGTTLLLRDAPETLPGVSAGGVFDSIRAMLLYYGGHGLRDSLSARLYGGFWDGMGSADLGDVDTVHFNSPQDRNSPYVDHLSADLSDRLPPSYLIGAELDPLADGTRALGTILGYQGHDVHWRVIPGVLHSFLHFGRMLDEANEVLAGGGEFVRARF